MAPTHSPCKKYPGSFEEVDWRYAEPQEFVEEQGEELEDDGPYVPEEEDDGSYVSEDEDDDTYVPEEEDGEEQEANAGSEEYEELIDYSNYEPTESEDDADLDALIEDDPVTLAHLDSVIFGTSDDEHLIAIARRLNIGPYAAEDARRAQRGSSPSPSEQGAETVGGEEPSINSPSFSQSNADSFPKCVAGSDPAAEDDSQYLETVTYDDFGLCVSVEASYQDSPDMSPTLPGNNTADEDASEYLETVTYADFGLSLNVEISHQDASAATDISPEISPASHDMTSASPDRSPATPNRSSATPNRSSAIPNRSSDSPDRSPASPDRFPASPGRSLAFPDASPIRKESCKRKLDSPNSDSSTQSAKSPNIEVKHENAFLSVQSNPCSLNEGEFSVPHLYLICGDPNCMLSYTEHIHLDVNRTHIPLPDISPASPDMSPASRETSPASPDTSASCDTSPASRDIMTVASPDMSPIRKESSKRKLDSPESNSSTQPAKSPNIEAKRENAFLSVQTNQCSLNEGDIPVQHPYLICSDANCTLSYTDHIHSDGNRIHICSEPINFSLDGNYTEVNRFSLSNVVFQNDQDATNNVVSEMDQDATSNVVSEIDQEAANDVSQADQDNTNKDFSESDEGPTDNDFSESYHCSMNKDP